MNSFLLIAVYGATLAIALAFTFTEYGNEKNTAVYKKSLDDFEPEFEDALRYRSQVEIQSKNHILSPPIKHTGEKRLQSHRI